VDSAYAAPSLSSARRYAAAAVPRRLVRRLGRHAALALLARNRPEGAGSLHLLRQWRLPARRGAALALPAAAAFTRQLGHLVRPPRWRPLRASGRGRHEPPDRGRLSRGKRDRHALQRPLLRSVPK